MAFRHPLRVNDVQVESRKLNEGMMVKRIKTVSNSDHPTLATEKDDWEYENNLNIKRRKFTTWKPCCGLPTKCLAVILSATRKAEFFERTILPLSCYQARGR